MNETKVCTVCNKELPLTDFYKDKRVKDGRQSDCKLCHCASAIKWQKKNPEKRNAHVKKYQKAHPELIDKTFQERALALNEYKSDCGCEICGECETVCLDFHHINPEEKDTNVSQLLTYNIETLISEIRKCILLCKNCHAKIHKYGLENKDGKFCIREHTDDTD